MTLEGIIDALKTYPALAAQVAGRIFPVGWPAGETLPGVTYEVLSTRKPASKDGPGSLVSATLRWTTWAAQQTQGRAVSILVEQALQWLRDTRVIHNAIPGSRNEDANPDPAAWLCITGYTIWWRE